MNPKTLLPEYVAQYMRLHGKYAEIKLMMEYYMFYETVSEGLSPYLASAEDMTERFNEAVGFFFEGNIRKEDADRLAEELLLLRREVVNRMQVLTSYVDCFEVYEYVLNRVQYRFEDLGQMPEDSVFAQELFKFVFSENDDALINDKLRLVVGQLPVRMARSRYFDLVRNSISLYKGSDKSALDGFLYMFRTNAMLYQDENMGRYFTEFIPLLEELSHLDYDAVSGEEYQSYAEKISASASKLKDISDLYMQLGQLINEMYVLCVTFDGREAAGTGQDMGRKEDEAARLVIRGIYALFLHQDSEIWERSGTVPVGTETEKLAWLGEQFRLVEGRQENISENLDFAGAALEGICESQKEVIAGLGLEKVFLTLKKLLLLSSNSVFADLEEKGMEEKVTGEMADEAAAALISECKAFFRGKSRLLRRAVMANTLERLPVFFASAQEAADYMVNALAQCEDEAEKYASKLLLLEMMRKK